MSYEVELPGGVRGRLDVPHLADHPAAVDALREAIGADVGAALGPLLVLERLEVNFLKFRRSTAD